MPLLEGSKISHIESVVMVKRSHEADSYPSKWTRRSTAHEEALNDVAHSESSADGMKIRISLPKKSQDVMKSASSLSLSSQASQASQASQTSANLMEGKEEKMEEAVSDIDDSVQRLVAQAMAEATAENEKSRRTQEETSQETEEPPEEDLDKTTRIDFGELQFGREYEIK